MFVSNQRKNVVFKLGPDTVVVTYFGETTKEAIEDATQSYIEAYGDEDLELHDIVFDIMESFDNVAWYREDANIIDIGENQ